jgi:hypothetical protein
MPPGIVPLVRILVAPERSIFVRNRPTTRKRE